MYGQFGLGCWPNGRLGAWVGLPKPNYMTHHTYTDERWGGLVGIEDGEWVTILVPARPDGG
jgi:hypothetical protein